MNTNLSVAYFKIDRQLRRSAHRRSRHQEFSQQRKSTYEHRGIGPKTDLPNALKPKLEILIFYERNLSCC